MKLALDVHYDEAPGRSSAAGVLFGDWTDAAAIETFAEVTSIASPYIPGEFFRRELPCLLSIIEPVRARVALETVIVDGYVDLGAGRPGLGRYLFEALDKAVRVIGVAKTHFAGSEGIAITRGQSATPLWITASSDAARAADAICTMHGPYRIPTLLKRVDQLARAGLSAAAAT